MRETRIGIVAVSAQFVYALLGPDHDGSPYTQQGEQIARLAASGIRLVIEQFRTDVTKTRQDGSRVKLRIDYGELRSPEQPIAWLRRYIDGARTAGELYGRALVVIAAEQHASRLVLPQSQRHPAWRWSSHKDRAARALKTLTGPHLPASLTQLEKAIKRAHRDYEHTEQAARERTRPMSGRQARSAAATDPEAADGHDSGRDADQTLDIAAAHEADDTSELDQDENGPR